MNFRPSPRLQNVYDGTQEPKPWDFASTRKSGVVTFPRLAAQYWKSVNVNGNTGREGLSKDNRMSLMLSLLIGGGLGAALGYFGKCSSGTCPLTANWWRGAVYGAVMGLLFHLISGRNGSNSAESTQNIKLIQEQQFEAEVIHANGPVVVDFFATWCGPCKRLSPMLDNLAEPLTNRVKFLKIDVDQSAKLAGQFAVEGVPTLIFFKDGKVVDKMVGLPAKDALKRKLEFLASPGGLAAGTQ